jgi:hypothetical protein
MKVKIFGNRIIYTDIVSDKYGSATISIESIGEDINEAIDNFNILVDEIALSAKQRGEHFFEEYIQQIRSKNGKQSE